MILDKVVTHLELSFPDDFVSGRPSPEVLSVALCDVGSAEILWSLHEEIGKSYYWKHRTFEFWVNWLSNPSTETWVISTPEQLAGIIDLEVQVDKGVEIVYFGLRPTFVGRGFGANALALAVQSAFTLRDRFTGVRNRVWLCTDDYDHPHAISNYTKRGFRIFKVTNEQMEVPDRQLKAFPPGPS